MTDYEPAALQCALLSASASGLQTPLASCVPSAPASVSMAESPGALAQMDALQKALQSEAHDVQQPDRFPSDQAGAACAIDAMRLDWTEPYTGPTYDVVIACDVLYEGPASAPLAALLPKLLNQNPRRDSHIVLSDEPTRTPYNRKAFCEKLAENDPGLILELDTLAPAMHRDAAESQKESSREDKQIVVVRRAQASDTVGTPLTAVKYHRE